MELLDYTKIKVFIQEDFVTGTTKVWVNERGLVEDFNIHFDGNKIVKTELPRGLIKNKNHKPLLTLPSGFALFLFDVITDHTVKKGLKKENENFIKGKLEATELHLNDMKCFSEKLLEFITTK